MTRNFLVGWIHSKGKIGGRHHGRMTLRWVMRIWYGISTSAIFWCPLLSARWTLSELPIVFKKYIKVVIVPTSWVSGPCTFQTASDGINTFAAAETAYPA